RQEKLRWSIGRINPCDDKRAVGLQHDAACRLIRAAKVSRKFTACAKGRIEAAVGVVARECELHLGADQGRANSDDLAIGLENRIVYVIELAEVGGNDA